MSIELMLLAVNLNFVAFSHFLGDLGGQIFVFFVLTVAAAESAIGLAISCRRVSRRQEHSCRRLGRIERLIRGTGGWNF